MWLLDCLVKHAQKELGTERVHVKGHMRTEEGKRVPVKAHWRVMKKGPHSKTFKPIPQTENETWDFSLQEHHAQRAGRHWDLRLGDPHGDAHSWAIRELPEPGKSTRAFQTFTHKRDYMDFQGRLEGGHGKGNVFLRERARALIHYAMPHRVMFSVPRGKSSGDYALVEVGEKTWILHHMTPPEEKIPRGRTRYKETPFEAKVLEMPDTIVSAKLDGARANFLLQPNKRLRAFSYRASKTKDLLEYTHKIPGLYGLKGKGSQPSVLVGEVLALGKEGKALPPEKTAGYLNSGILKSREDQAQRGHTLQPFLFDVQVYKGRTLAHLPYAERLDILKNITTEYPVFRLAPTAQTPEEKKQLFRTIKDGAHPLTDEGVVLWSPKGPVKAKKKEEHDVYVREVFAGAGRLAGKAAGGFRYSWTPSGPIVGKVGTGFTDAAREDLWKNRKKYTGRVARVTALNKYESGALAKPSFQSWHVEKNIQ